MPKPSQVIVLVEDNRHQQFVLRYLRRIGLERHAMRFVPSPSGAGSGEQWVREQFAIEVATYRRRRVSTETKLVVVIDADDSSVQERLAQFDQNLREAGADALRLNTEQIARLVPKRNIETWILCLNDIQVGDRQIDEGTDYKRRRTDWPTLIRAAAEQLFTWTRKNAQIPEACVPSLRLGVAELRRLDFEP